MDSNALELRLGAEKQCYIPQSITHFLNHLSTIRDVSDRLSELNDYVSKLELEMRKLDSLKRNPQRCMLLLKDAVEFLKKEGEKMKRDIETEETKWPALKEFLPLKRSFNEQEQGCHFEKRHKSTITIPIPKPCKLSIGGGAFTPFRATMAKTEAAVTAEEPVLSLLLPGTQNSSRTQLGGNYQLLEQSINGGNQTVGFTYPVLPKTNYIGNGDSHHHHHLHHQQFNLQAEQQQQQLLQFNLQAEQQQQQQQQQQHQAIWKNNRRCWSPELHARFMAAMDFLGGPEVATPKQIRAVMQVEGLTNDQVKSHLQVDDLPIYQLQFPKPTNTGFTTMDNMQKIQSLQIDKQVSNSQGNPRATPETLGAQGVSPTYVNDCLFSLRPLLLKMLIGPKTRKFYGLQRPVLQPGDIDAKLLS